MARCTNIGRTMFVKSGGEPWSVQIPTKSAMVIGISEQDAPDGGRFCSVVSSTNTNMTQYSSCTTASGEKVGYKCLQDAMGFYSSRTNNAPPSNVVIFVEVPDFSVEAKDSWTSAVDEMKEEHAADNESE